MVCKLNTGSRTHQMAQLGSGIEERIPGCRKRNCGLYRMISFSFSSSSCSFRSESFFLLHPLASLFLSILLLCRLSLAFLLCGMPPIPYLACRRRFRCCRCLSAAAFSGLCCLSCFCCFQPQLPFFKSTPASLSQQFEGCPRSQSAALCFSRFKHIQVATVRHGTQCSAK